MKRITNKSSSSKIYEGNDNPACSSRAVMTGSSAARILFNFLLSPPSSCVQSESNAARSRLFTSPLHYFNNCTPEAALGAHNLNLHILKRQKQKRTRGGGVQNLSLVLRLSSLCSSHTYPWNGPCLSPPLALQPIKPPTHPTTNS